MLHQDSSNRILECIRGHWLQVGANPFSESDVTQMNMVQNHIFPEGPRGADNFFLYYQTLIPTAKETRSPLVSPSSRSIHLLFDLGTILGDISLCWEGVQPGTHSKICSKNHSRRSEIASMLLKTVLSVPKYHLWMVQTTNNFHSSC